ncbi:MAG: hypothetical protein HC875_31895 [Anaerolineales bacterium]|nr:hypothetical protein [Anaerolineales bacterium]
MLIFLETEAQVNWFVANNSTQSQQKTALAITPSAAYACQKLDQPYLKLEDHTRLLERSKEYTYILSDYLQWEAWLDEWAQHHVPEFRTSGFKPATATTFLLQMLFAEIWSTAVTLDELLKALKPSQIGLWLPTITDVPWHLQPTISLISALLPSLAYPPISLEIVDLGEQIPALKPVSEIKKTPFNFNNLFVWAKRQLRQHPLIVGVVKEGPKSILTAFKLPNQSTPRILFSGYAYDLEPLARELHHQGIHTTVLSDILPSSRLMTQTAPLSKALRQKLTTTGKQLLQEAKLWAPLEKWGLKHFSLWSTLLLFWWEKLVPELWLYYQRVLPLLQQKKFAALVTWDVSGSSLSSAAANAAAIAQTPCYVYQHGSSSGIDARLWTMYLRNCDTFLAYGTGTVDEFKQSCPEFLSPQARLKSVGSPRLDLLRQQYQPKRVKSCKLAYKPETPAR